MVEADGLRCPLPRVEVRRSTATCLEQPAERDNTNFRDRVRVTAGKAQELGGLVWAYVGPDPAPLLPRFDIFVMDGVRDIGWTDLPCNFVQIMENAVDPHHVEWLHGRYFEFMGRHEGFDAPASFGKKHIKVGFDVVRVGHHQAPRARGRHRGERRLEGRPPARVPVQHAGRRRGHRPDADPGADRPHHHAVHALHGARAGGRRVPRPAAECPDYRIPVFDEDGRHVTDYVEGQDIMAWVTQGPITDRTTEHLGRSDIGVTMLRRMFKEQMDAVAGGEDPLGTIREPHDRIDLPCEKNKFDAGPKFALDFIEGASSKFSPQADALKKLHLKAWENREAGDS